MIIRLLSQDFPGGPETKTLPSNARGAGSIPGQGAKILHVCMLSHFSHVQLCATLGTEALQAPTCLRAKKTNE